MIGVFQQAEPCCARQPKPTYTPPVSESKPPAEPVAWIGPIRAWYQRALFALWKPGSRACVTGMPPSSGGFYLSPFSVGSPVNGSMNSFILIWSAILSSLNWFWMYFWIAVLLRSTVSTKNPLHQKCRFPYLYFKFANRSKIINALFPFNIPMNLDTDIFGGIDTNMWIWSTHAYAFNISTSYLSQMVLSIFPISALYLP